MNKYLKSLAFPLLIILLTAGMPKPSLAASPAVPLTMNSSYSGFDSIDYIEKNHRDLRPFAEAISHWAAYYSINPILLTQVLNARAKGELPTHEIIETVAGDLAVLAGDQSRTDHVDGTPADGLAARIDKQFSLGADTSARVLELTRIESASAGLAIELINSPEKPPALDLPFTKPQAWQFNGVHTWTGNDDGSAMSSLDFTRTWSQNWGDNTSTDWVDSAHDGEVTVYSSCFVQVQHDSGWATRYYHLDNLQVATGDRVKAGDQLANYANQRDQALCSGGSSTGPHLHFALLKDGTYFSLQDIALSGYLVHPGDSSYDSARSRMWIEKRGTRFYAFDKTLVQQEGDNTIDYRYNGMWFSIDHNGHGLNVEITESGEDDSSRKTVFVVMYTYDDEGLANFYVGNRDFDRWRPDESMVIDMLQTSGGDFSSLSPVDFNNSDEVRPAGTAEVQFLSCSEAHIYLDLDERSAGQPNEHSISLVKLIGVPDHVCEAASLPLQ
jgi:hypothetical protein